ncbi:LysR family transcriptional regulator [Paraburkholderia sp. GAS334]|uniref:LysR family transcriptional regulator n=1 Tax=Paraburkholderia sp. GAS334 TaxID=3035131 RepID=UPI003D1E4C6A
MDQLIQIELFVRTVELGSISRAAEELGLSNAAASWHLRSLDERLSARLLERITRRQCLTEGGRTYHQRCLIIVAELAVAELGVNDSNAKSTGVLRVTSSVSFAMMRSPSLKHGQSAHRACQRRPPRS